MRPFDDILRLERAEAFGSARNRGAGRCATSAAQPDGLGGLVGKSLLSLVGGTLSGAGAALGGHLGYRQATGANHGEEVPHVGPGNWQPLGPLAEFPSASQCAGRCGYVPCRASRRVD